MRAYKKIIVLASFVLFSTAIYSQNAIKFATTLKQRLDSTVNIASGDKYEFSYNNLGHNISSVNYTWSNPLMKYEKSSKHEYTYNVKGYCSLDQTFIWDKTLSQWLIRDKVEQSYDENNQILLSNKYEWNKTDSKWDFIIKTDFQNTYDSKERLISVIKYMNNKEGSTQTKSEYSYNENENLSSIINYTWVSYAWNEFVKEGFAYDAQGNLTTITTFSWRTTPPKDWVTGSVFELKYNNEFTFNQLLIPLNYFPHWSLLPSDYNVSHMITLLNETKRYYYSSIEVTGIRDQKTLETKVFPNPATDYLNIQWNGNQSFLNVELIDVMGTKVFSGLVENNSKLPIKAYAKGLYLVNISDGNRMLKTEKLFFQ